MNNICLRGAFAFLTFMGMSIRHVDASLRTTAMGMHQSIYAIGMFSGPAVAGVIADAVGLPAMFGATAGLCLAASIAVLAIMNKYKNHHILNPKDGDYR